MMIPVEEDKWLFMNGDEESVKKLKIFTPYEGKEP